MIKKKKEEKLIPQAIKIIEREYNEKKILPKELPGYVDNFSAAIIQSGVLPAVIFNNREGVDEKFINKRKLMKIIFELIGIKVDCVKSILEDMIRNEGRVSKELKNEITIAIIAVKLSLRVFEFDKSIDKEG